jgi:hypothetical protein
LQNAIKQIKKGKKGKHRKKKKRKKEYNCSKRIKLQHSEFSVQGMVMGKQK